MACPGVQLLDLSLHRDPGLGGLPHVEVKAGPPRSCPRSPLPPKGPSLPGSAVLFCSPLGLFILCSLCTCLAPAH